MILCIKCNVKKPETDYYKSQIRNNNRGQCKECTKARVRANRAANAEYYKEFDRNRANLPHRVQARKDYQATKQGKKALAKSKAAHYYRYPNRSAARSAVTNAVRDGRLHKPSECESCNDTTTLHGHHCDYNKPLDVMWLCDPCHKQWHRDNKPIYCDESEIALTNYRALRANRAVN